MYLSLRVAISACVLILIVSGRVPPARDPCLEYLTEPLPNTLSLSISMQSNTVVHTASMKDLSQSNTVSDGATASSSKEPIWSNSSSHSFSPSQSRSRLLPATQSVTHRSNSQSTSLTMTNDLSRSDSYSVSDPLSVSRSRSEELSMSFSRRARPARTATHSPSSESTSTASLRWRTPTYVSAVLRSPTATRSDPCATASLSFSVERSDSATFSTADSESTSLEATASSTESVELSQTATDTAEITSTETITESVIPSLSQGTLSSSVSLENVTILLPSGNRVASLELALPENLTLVEPLLLVLQGTLFNLAWINVTNRTSSAMPMAAPPLSRGNISNGASCFVVEDPLPGSSPYVQRGTRFFQENMIVLVTTSRMGEAWLPTSTELFRDVEEDLIVNVRVNALCLNRADLTNLTFSFTIVAPNKVAESLSSAEEFAAGGLMIAATFAGSPGVGYLACRSVMPLNVQHCEHPQSGPLSLLLSPIPWGVGDWLSPPPLGATVFLTGALILNVVIVLVVALVQIALSLTYYVVSNTSMLKGFILLRFPSIAFVPLAALLHQITSLSAMFVTIGARYTVMLWDAEDGDGDMDNSYFFSHAPVTLWMGVGVLVVAIMMPVVYLAAIRACAATRVISRLHPSSCGAAFFLGNGKWINTKGSEILHCTTRYFLLIVPFRNDCRGWHIVELFLCVFLGGVDGIRLGSGECNPILVGVSLGITFLYAAALVWWRPCSATIGNVLLILIAAAQCTAYATLIAYNMTHVLDSETRRLLSTIVLWCCRGSLFASFLKALLDIAAVVYVSFCMNWDPAAEEEQEGKDSVPMLAVPEPSEGEDRKAIVHLAYTVHDEIVTEPALQKDEHLVERYVAALLQLTTPGLEAEGQRRILTLLEEIDALSLVNRQGRLLTPQMELLHMKLSSLSRPAAAPSQANAGESGDAVSAMNRREDANSSTNGSFRIDFSPTSSSSSSKAPVPTEADRQRHIDEMLGGNEDPMLLNRYI